MTSRSGSAIVSVGVPRGAQRPRQPVRPAAQQVRHDAAERVRGLGSCDMRKHESEQARGRAHEQLRRRAWGKAKHSRRLWESGQPADHGALLSS